MGKDESLRLHTDRLLLREVDADDLQDLHRVFASNPDFLHLREDIGTYGLESVTRYWEAATLDPERHVLLIARQGTEVVIGLVDFVEQSPADGKPWIGLVMIHGSHQRRGFGTEAVHAVTDLVGSQGHDSLRMAVLEGNEAGLAFARHVGFEAFGQGGAAAEGADRRIALMELMVGPRDAG